MFKELTQNLNELNSRSEAVKEMIESHKEIVILRHQRPDPDAYGSQLGLKTYLQNKYPGKTIYAYGEEETSLSFLGSMDEEKDLEDVLIIAVDTANLERLDGSLNSKKNLIKIDHHPDREQYGDVSIVETAVSSTSELLYLLMRTWDEDAIDKDTAALLYMGIVGDTGRFLYNNTTELTLLVASKLIKYGFDASGLITKMHQTSKNAFQYKGYIIDQAVFRPSGIAYTYVPKNIMEDYGLSVSEAGLDVNIFREIDEVKVWFLALENEDEIRVRLRSKELVINDIAAEFGGGGHPLASGVRVKDLNELDTLIKRIEEKML